jgi:hypothetical protein
MHAWKRNWNGIMNSGVKNNICVVVSLAFLANERRTKGNDARSSNCSAEQQLGGRQCSEPEDYPGGAELSTGDVRRINYELPIPLPLVPFAPQ